jgi:hypothetical protein
MPFDAKSPGSQIDDVQTIKTDYFARLLDGIESILELGYVFVQFASRRDIPRSG